MIGSGRSGVRGAIATASRSCVHGLYAVRTGVRVQSLHPPAIGHCAGRIDEDLERAAAGAVLR